MGIMKNLRNLKIRAKLFSTFAIVLVFSILIGVLAIISFNAMGNSADNYVHISIPATAYMLHSRQEMLNYQINILECTQVQSEEEYNAEVTAMQTHQATFLQFMDMLQELAPQFEDGLNNVRTLMTQEEAIRTRILAEAAKHSDEGNTAAYNIYKTELLPLMEQVNAELDAINEELNLAIQQRYANAQKTQNIVTWIIIAVMAFSVVNVITLSFMLSKVIAEPVREIATAMDNIAEGKISAAEVKYSAKDELGALAESSRKTIAFFQTVMPDIAMICTNMGDGNFNIVSEHPECYVGETEEIRSSLRYVRNNLSETIGQVGSAADQLLSGADQVAAGASALAQGATEQASSVEELAATINDLSAKVHQTAENSGIAQGYTDAASASIKESTEHMTELINAMNEINNTSNEISQIIKTIDDISFQTNILALNAAIEAARAGDAGKGFAVVADEVRNLAGKSAEAAHHTTELIENSLSAVRAGMEQLNATSEALNDVVEKEDLMSDKVREITAAAVEQSEAIKQITTGVDQISDVVQTNSATAEQSAAAAEELSSQANFLRDMVEKFTIYEG